jgi:hypothetical protein
VRSSGGLWGPCAHGPGWFKASGGYVKANEERKNKFMRHDLAKATSMEVDSDISEEF